MAVYCVVHASRMRSTAVAEAVSAGLDLPIFSHQVAEDTVRSWLQVPAEQAWPSGQCYPVDEGQVEWSPVNGYLTWLPDVPDEHVVKVGYFRVVELITKRALVPTDKDYRLVVPHRPQADADASWARTFGGQREPWNTELDPYVKALPGAVVLDTDRLVSPEGGLELEKLVQAGWPLDIPRALAALVVR